MTRPTVLLPVDLVDRETIAPGLVEFLSPASVLLLGLHSIPGQTSPKQARSQFLDADEEYLHELASQFDGEVETQVSYTHNGQKTIERVAAEIDKVGIVILGPAPNVDRVLVAIRGEINLPMIAEFVGLLLAGTDVEVTLYHATSEDDTTPADHEVLTALSEEIAGYEVDRTRITETVEHTDSPVRSFVEEAGEHDLLIVGEDKPTLVDRIFGDTHRKIARTADVPALVIRRPPE